MDKIDEIVLEKLQLAHISLSDQQQGQLARYAELLLETNQQFNLLSQKTTATDIWHRHILNCLLLTPLIGPDCKNILDVGSGAGLPGIIFAIAYPAIQVTMIESRGKKAHFIQSIIEELNLTNTSVRAERAEELAHDPTLREQFDVVTARALAPLPTLLELTIPFLRIHGKLLAIKGERHMEEVERSQNALKTLDCAVNEYVSIDNQSTVVVIKKQSATQPHYPRATGLPKKLPL